MKAKLRFKYFWRLIIEIFVRIHSVIECEKNVNAPNSTDEDADKKLKNSKGLNLKNNEIEILRTHLGRIPS